MTRSAAPGLALALAVAACTGTDVGNPAHIDLDISLYHADLGAAAVTEGWVSVDRIRLRPAADCSGGAATEFVGPFAIDLLEPGPIPALRGLEIPPAGYCRFELRWDGADAAPPGAPAELAGAGLLLAGARADGTPFLLRSERKDELRLDAVSGSFTVDDATSALFVGLDGQALFAGLDLGAAVVDDGRIRIEPGRNQDLLDRFEDNVREATRLFQDKNANGILDEDERDPDDSLAE